jgi:hypothetical protein
MSKCPDLSTEIRELRKAMLLTQWLGGLLILGLITFIVADRIGHPETVEASQTKTVRANQFLLTDDVGNVIARLGAQRFDGTCLTLGEKENSGTARLCAREDGSSGLDLSKKGDQASITLSTGNDAAEQGTELAQINTGLLIRKGGDKDSIDLIVGNDETSFFMGHGGNPSTVISTSQGKSVIDLFGQHGQRIWSAP